MHKSASSMTSNVGSQPPTARKSARRKNMAWSPNSSRRPRRKSSGRNSRGAYQVLIQLWKLVPKRTRSGPLSRGVKPAKAVPGSASTLRITATASSGSKVLACSTQIIGAVASCTPRLIAAARPRVLCRTTSSPAASAMATEASALPPSTASTSAGGGSSAASERNNRGSPAASLSRGMTMATPVIASGFLRRELPRMTAGTPASGCALLPSAKSVAGQAVVQEVGERQCQVQQRRDLFGVERDQNRIQHRCQGTDQDGHVHHLVIAVDQLRQ